MLSGACGISRYVNGWQAAGEIRYAAHLTHPLHDAVVALTARPRSREYAQDDFCRAVLALFDVPHHRSDAVAHDQPTSVADPATGHREGVSHSPYRSARTSPSRARSSRALRTRGIRIARHHQMPPQANAVTGEMEET